MSLHRVTLASLISLAALSAASAQQAPSEKAAQHAAALRAQARVTEAAARATALKDVPGGTIKEGGLEREGGKLIYSFDIKVAGRKGIEEVQVDASTGKIVSREHESDAAEAKEARDDAKAKPATAAAPVRKPDQRL